MPSGLKTIVLASRKGGAGKTTLTAALAVEAERSGAGPVAVMDTDPQGGLAAWWNEREAEAPAFLTAGTDLPQVKRAAARQGIQMLLVDTPPAIGETIAATLSLADLVLVPVRPSPNDLRAASATVDLIVAARRRMVFIVNAVKPRVRLTGEAAIALSQYGTVAPAMVWDRADYAGAMTDGRTAPELDPGGRAAAEIAALWSYILNRLEAPT